MKALSITRPWAELILRGKDVENRTWDTKFRGARTEASLSGLPPADCGQSCRWSPLASRSEGESVQGLADCGRPVRGGEPMKALSITRPWAELILRGKDVENRTWDTKFRGAFLLHAAQSWAKDAMAYAQWVELRNGGYDFSDLSWRAGDHPTGIVGVAEITNVCSVEMASAEDRVTKLDWPCQCGPWAMPAQHHWKLTNVRRLPRPVPCRGALGLWTPPAEVLAAVEAQYAEIEVTS